jgi:hypothetical protein
LACPAHGIIWRAELMQMILPEARHRRDDAAAQELAHRFAGAQKLAGKVDAITVSHCASPPASAARPIATTAAFGCSV